MRIRVTPKTLRNTVAIAAIMAAASGLAGCSTFGLGSDGMTTGSTGYQGTSNLNQAMPNALGPTTRVAEGPYVPPENVGGGYGRGTGGGGYVPLPPASAPGAISSQDLPVIGTPSSNGNYTAMSAQPASQPLPSASAPKAPPAMVASAPTATPNLPVVPGGVYTHVIRSGESLYTIARHYGVTAQAIMQASHLPAPDKIYVGQRVVIPGRPDLLAAMDDAKLPPGSDKLPVDSSKPVLASEAPEPAAVRPHAPETRVASLDNSGAPVVPLAGRILTSAPASHAPAASAALPEPVVPAPHSASSHSTARPAGTAATAAPQPAHAAPAAAAPTQVATATQPAPKMPLQEPAMSGAEKFRWPVNGKVIVNFAGTHGTGINIAAPAGTPVKAAENGTVIYVGSGVEGYGNLILIRHANGYVSAYANLKDMSVQKGAVVGRGDTIGSAGATGSVTSPQLHFELRKGATPVDPVPLLAG
jgi:murein DD-endopeptidase MepM/ murein hydrolase activator NlpD